MKLFPLCDVLSENPARYCAALVVTKNIIEGTNSWPRFAEPSHTLRNGTLTFVKSEGRVFGITCWHVIEHFRKQLQISGNAFSHSLRTMVNGFYFVHDRFIRPESQFGDPPIDIAIRQINPDLLSDIGKEAIDLDLLSAPPQPLTHGLGVGFPETAKYKRMEDQIGYRVSMPQVEILAEIDGLPTRRFTLFSELNEKPIHTDYSGMSGGPIFWSTENDFGVFGIIYEGGVGSELSDGNTVYLYGELATPVVIKSWINKVFG